MLWTPQSEIAIAHNLPATPSTTTFGYRWVDALILIDAYLYQYDKVIPG